jgi:serine/threonine protein kinase
MSLDSNLDEVEALFHRALQMPPDSRVSFIAQHAAGNEMLRREVLSLVRAVESADSMCGTTLRGEEQAPGTIPIFAVGNDIGPYRLERQLGRGGMGEVFAARRRDSTLDSEVALKVIAGKMDSERLRTLFLQERDLLSQVRHPNIARLLDGGIEGNTPYLVMELVVNADGDPERLDEHCATHRLSLQQRIQKVIAICDAVSYAHQKLIAHGDLKPGNVLVSADGEAKLLDFGAARLLTAEDGVRAGAFTPEFSSPEQCLGEPITVQSDVYSMGKLLNRVIAGFEDPELAAAISKATQREPADRYAGIGGFADDLRSWIKRMPLTACSGRSGYVLRKWIVRYWPLLSGLSLVFVALLLLTIQAHRSDRRALAERDRATIAARDVQTLAHRLLFELEPQLRDLGSSTEAQRQLAKTTLDYLGQLDHSPGLLDDSLGADVVKAYMQWGNLLGNPYDENLGQPEAGEAAMRNAVREADAYVRSRPVDLDARYALAMAQESLAEIEFGEGKGTEALNAMLQAMQSFDWVLQQPRVTVDQMIEAAATEGSIGDVFALPGEGSLGKVAEAQAWYRKSIALDQRILAIDSGYTRARRGIALAETKIGNLLLEDKPFEAVIQYKAALDIFSTMPLAAQRARPAMRLYNGTEGHLARALAKLGHYQDAIATMISVRDRSAEAAALDPLDDQARYDLFAAQTGLGDVFEAAGKHASARQAYLNAMATVNYLIRKQPNNPVFLDHRQVLKKAIESLGAN